MSQCVQFFTDSVQSMIGKVQMLKPLRQKELITTASFIFRPLLRRRFQIQNVRWDSEDCKFVNSRPLNSWIFIEHCDKMGRRYMLMPFHLKVQLLLWGRFLVFVFTVLRNFVIQSCSLSLWAFIICVAPEITMPDILFTKIN